MFELNIKVSAFMLFSILMVHGKIYQEERYLMDANHVERYRRLYSDDRSDVFDNTDSKPNFDVPDSDDRSDVFDNTDSKPNFDVPDWGMENLGEGLPNEFPRFVEDNNGPEKAPIHDDFDNEKGLSSVFPVEDNRLDFEEPRKVDLPHMFPVDNNGLNQDMPSWFPINVNGGTRPRWIPGGVGEARNKYPASRLGRDDMKRKCQNIKGLPTPDSGCCGVQMTRSPIQYPNISYKPWWPQLHRHPGGRFTRSADKDILPSGMIRGGKATDLHQFPWMVRLSIDTTVSGIGTPKSCGGTIISSRYVLTAAHCLDGQFKHLKQLTVILAEYNSDTFPEDCNGQGCILNKESNVERVIMHPDFNSTLLQNDVALLRLSEDIHYSDYVRPVCLPTEDIADLGEEPLIIAGWGLNGKTESNLKRSAIVNYVPDDKCEQEYSYKDDSMFCSIGGNGEDICKGDSGGPLMVHSDGKFFLSGIVNGKRQFVNCGSEVPSLFNNVFYHLDWIKNNVH